MTDSGNQWILETKATFSLLDGADSRDFFLIIVFDAMLDQKHFLAISRGKGILPGQVSLNVRLCDDNTIIASADKCQLYNDTTGVKNFTYYYRITRQDTLVKVEISEDGKNFKQIFSSMISSGLRGLIQKIALTGSSWFVPAGSYADWDYIRFKILD